MVSGIKGWFLALSVGKKIAVGASSFLVASTTVGAVMPPAEQVSQEQPERPAIVETKQVTETETIEFETEEREDDTLEKGKEKVSQEGENGVKTFTYEVTYTDGEETGRKLISEEVTKKPIKKIILVGTTVSPPPLPPPPPPPPVSNDCDPNYSGACVPIASDVDCAGGSGNGPAYVSGPVYVEGIDIYDLDRDGNGVGCE